MKSALGTCLNNSAAQLIPDPARHLCAGPGFFSSNNKTMDAFIYYTLKPFRVRLLASNKKYRKGQRAMTITDEVVVHKYVGTRKDGRHLYSCTVTGEGHPESSIHNPQSVDWFKNQCIKGDVSALSKYELAKYLWE